MTLVEGAPLSAIDDVGVVSSRSAFLAAMVRFNLGTEASRFEVSSIGESVPALDGESLARFTDLALGAPGRFGNRASPML